jgi:hypothetical protein
MICSKKVNKQEYFASSMIEQARDMKKAIPPAGRMAV